jgi:hypothetical protein
MTENEQPQSLFQKHKEEVTETLRRIDKRLCLGEYTATSDVENILLMSKEELKKLDREECKNHAFLLNRHALFIQKDLNHFAAWEDQATRIKAKCLDVDQKVLCDRIIEAAHVNILKAQYLPKRIEAMAKSLDNLAFERKKNEYN